MAKVVANTKAGQTEDLNFLLKKFKKQVKRDGIIDECRKRKFFVPKSLKRKEKSKRAKIKRILAQKKYKK